MTCVCWTRRSQSSAASGTAGDYRWEFTEAGRDFDLAVDGRLTAKDGALMVRAALDGVGLAHVLESMVERELSEKRLVRVLADFCPPFPGYFLYYPSRLHVGPKVRPRSSSTFGSRGRARAVGRRRLAPAPASASRRRR